MLFKLLSEHPDVAFFDETRRSRRDGAVCPGWAFPRYFEGEVRSKTSHRMVEVRLSGRFADVVERPVPRTFTGCFESRHKIV